MSFYQTHKRKFDILFWIAIGAVLIWKVILPRIPTDIEIDDLQFRNEQGEVYTLDDYKGKNVVINFYQSWCGPCMMEMPHLDEAYKQLKAHDFEYILLSDESFELINQVKNRAPYQLNFFQSITSFRDVGIQAFPTTLLLNKEGEVVYNERGARLWNSPNMIEEFKELVE